MESIFFEDVPKYGFEAVLGFLYFKYLVITGILEIRAALQNRYSMEAFNNEI